MARISVLMGIYNCAPTLQEALDSLYAQTYQDFKIILCDFVNHCEKLGFYDSIIQRSMRFIEIIIPGQETISGFRTCFEVQA